jgi:hypothetical protein
MMTGTKFLTAITAIALGASGALADDTSSASTSFTITGVAVPVCVLSSPAASGSSVNATFALNTVSLTQLIDPNTALVNDSALTLEVSHAMCNYAAWLSLGSRNGGLTSSNASGVASGSGGFLTVVPYTAAATWGGMSVSLDTTSGLKVAKAQATGANSGSLVINVATQKSQLPVVQGTYSDVLTVKLGAPL